MPVDAVKVLIVERNGAELQNAEEFNLTSAVIPFTASGFVADNAQSGIIEAGIFGQKFYNASDTSETSTNSLTTWATKLTISPTNLLSGTYRLGFCAIMKTDNANRETDIRIFDGTNTLWEVRASQTRVQGSLPISGFIFLPGISGNKTYSLQFKVGGSSTTVYLRDAHMSLWRVS